MYIYMHIYPSINYFEKENDAKVRVTKERKNAINIKFNAKFSSVLVT